MSGWLGFVDEMGGWVLWLLTSAILSIKLNQFFMTRFIVALHYFQENYCLCKFVNFLETQYNSQNVMIVTIERALCILTVKWISHNTKQNRNFLFGKVAIIADEIIGRGWFLKRLTIVLTKVFSGWILCLHIIWTAPNVCSYVDESFIISY